MREASGLRIEKYIIFNKEVIKISIVTMVKEIKNMYPTSIALIKVGKFYKVYGKDAYVLSYLFEYKTREEGKVITCGFPTQIISKIQANLEKQKVNYLIFDRRDEYKVVEQEDYKDLNNYNKVFEKSRIYVNNQKRIENIHNSLISNVKSEDLKKLLRKIEEDIYEYDEGKI